MFGLLVIFLYCEKFMLQYINNKNYGKNRIITAYAFVLPFYFL